MLDGVPRSGVTLRVVVSEGRNPTHHEAQTSKRLLNNSFCPRKKILRQLGRSDISSLPQLDIISRQLRHQETRTLRNNDTTTIERKCDMSNNEHLYIRPTHVE